MRGYEGRSSPTIATRNRSTVPTTARLVWTSRSLYQTQFGSIQERACLILDGSQSPAPAPVYLFHATLLPTILSISLLPHAEREHNLCERSLGEPPRPQTAFGNRQSEEGSEVGLPLFYHGDAGSEGRDGGSALTFAAQTCGNRLKAAPAVCYA